MKRGNERMDPITLEADGSVLVVDDEPDGRLMLVAVFAPVGHAVTDAPDGQEDQGRSGSNRFSSGY
jgi:CheY-like chemotaxis protein